jgi:hypothetical protein
VISCTYSEPWCILHTKNEYVSFVSLHAHFIGNTKDNHLSTIELQINNCKNRNSVDIRFIMQSMVPGIKIVFLLYVLQFILIIGNVETHSGSGTYNSDPLMNITIDNGQIYFHVQYYGSILG